MRRSLSTRHSADAPKAQARNPSDGKASCEMDSGLALRAPRNDEATCHVRKSPDRSAATPLASPHIQPRRRPMTDAEIQEFVTRFAAAWAARDGKAFLDLWHPEGSLHTPLVGRRVAGNELDRLMEVQIAAAPDFVWQLLDWTSRGDVVIIEWQTTRNVGGMQIRMARRRQVPDQERQDHRGAGLYRHRAAARVPQGREAGADHAVLRTV